MMVGLVVFFNLLSLSFLMLFFLPRKNIGGGGGGAAGASGAAMGGGGGGAIGDSTAAVVMSRFLLISESGIPTAVLPMIKMGRDYRQERNIR